ncbi:MAG: toprim domain-containing protein [Microthrixaceae bacterium]|nr:toprim domain-containing protein [Microthrixaceae bacterium]
MWWVSTAPGSTARRHLRDRATEDHVQLLSRFTRRILLAYDADEAGRSAAERVYAWEKAHDVDFSVVELPGGADPDELAREDPEALAAAVVGARPFVEFRVQRALTAGDLGTPEGRARAADAALGVIAPITMRWWSTST